MPVGPTAGAIPQARASRIVAKKDSRKASPAVDNAMTVFRLLGLAMVAGEAARSLAAS